VTGFPFTLQLQTAAGTHEWQEEELAEVPTPIQDLIETIQGPSAGRIGGETAVHIVEILAAAYEAAATGTAVQVNS
jgi:predicted dehydrogenase